MMSRNRSGISPVMATVILVAIAIVIAIAVAFWATGLVGVFTRFEKIEITAAYPTKSDQEVVVILKVKNTGSAAATIDDIYVNGMPLGEPGEKTWSASGGTTFLDPGDTAIITVFGPTSDSTFVSGVTYEIAVHTASGKTYPVAVLIP